MMNDMPKILLSLSISGSFMMAIVFFLKFIFSQKLSRKWQYYIWLIVIVRMILPFGNETSIVGNIFKKYDSKTININSEMQTDKLDFNYTDFLYDIPSEIQSDKNIKTSEKPSYDIFVYLKDNLMFIWIMVASLMLIRKITIYQSFIRYVKAGKTEVTDIKILEKFGKIVEQQNIDTAIELYTNNLISSPLLIGFFKPCIVLPSTDISESDFYYTVLHELTHYRQKDMFYKWLVQLTVCIHWFNPSVYLMANEIGKDCELSCDEIIIKSLNDEQKHLYGTTLLNAMLTKGNYKNSIASVTLNESKELLKERLDAIMKFNKNSNFKMIYIPIFITLLLCLSSFAMGAYIVPTATTNSSKIVNSKINSKNISIDVYNGGVEIQKSSSENITADYDSKFYDVLITGEKVEISGKQSMMGGIKFVQLYLPENSKIDVDVEDGSFEYKLPTDFKGSIEITAKNSDVNFKSENQYKNCNVAIRSESTEYFQYGMIDCPEYFNFQNGKYGYNNGTELIDVLLTGYCSINFADIPKQHSQPTDLSEIQNGKVYAPDSNGEIKIPVSIDNIKKESDICIAQIPNLKDAIEYNYDIESTDGIIYVGMQKQKSQTEPYDSWYNYVKSSNKISSSSMSVGYDSSYTGDYNIYIGSDKTASNVSGYITIKYKSENTSTIQNEQYSKETSAIQNNQNSQTYSADEIYVPDSNGEIKIPVSIDNIVKKQDICIAQIPDIKNITGYSYNIKSKDDNSKLYVGMHKKIYRQYSNAWHNWVSEYGSINVSKDSPDKIGYGESSYMGDYVICIGSEENISDVTGYITVQYSK